MTARTDPRPDRPGPDHDPQSSDGAAPPDQRSDTERPQQDGPQGSGDYQPDPRRWRALAICLVIGFMTLLDVSIVNVALPSIREGLGASQSDLQWVLSGYALTFGLVLVGAGRLGDVRGRRTIFLVGLVGFVAASALCGFATTPTWLSISRLAQGVAAGVLTPQVTGIIQQLFRGPERGKAFGLFGTTIGVSTAVGPLLGGLLILAFGETDGWRWVFFVNLPIGLIALPFAWRLVPAKPSEERQRIVQQGSRGDLDPVGLVLLAVSVVCILLPLVEERQWTGNLKWLLLAGGVVLLAVFALWERRYGRRGHSPMIDLRLFTHRSYTLGTTLALVYFAGFTPIFFVVTLYLQTGLHYSALHAGLTLTPFAVGSAVTAAAGGRLVHDQGRRLVVLGLLMLLVGLVATDLIVGRASGGSEIEWLIAGPLLLAGLGSGLVIAPNQTVTLSQVPVEQGGTAGGVLQTGQRIGAALGIAVVGVVFFGQLMDTRGDYSAALSHGLWVTVGLLVLATLVGATDLVLPDHHRGRHRH